MDEKKVELGDRLLGLLVRFFFRFLASLPPSAAYVFSRILATLVCFFDLKHRRIGMINLGIAFPAKSEKWRKKILYKSFRRLGVHAVELARLEKMSPEELRNKVRYDQTFEFYKKVKEEGRGLIFMTAHLGCWELISTAHGAHGHRLHVLVRPLDNPVLDDWISGIRNKFGGAVIQKNNALRQMLYLLKQKEEVGILPDQNVQEKDGVYASLFGRPAATSAGLAAIAMKTKCPVIAAFIFPDKQFGKYVIKMSPPVEVVSTGDREGDLVANTQTYNRLLEEAIRRYPEGWLWGHRRFKTQPDGEDPYKSKARITF